MCKKHWRARIQPEERKPWVKYFRNPDEVRLYSPPFSTTLFRKSKKVFSTTETSKTKSDLLAIPTTTTPSGGCAKKYERKTKLKLLTF
jgi:hypothetical protein